MKSTWNERYSKPEFHYGTSPNDFLNENWSAFKANGRILCLAEGEGRNAVFLARQGFQVTAVDISDVGLKKLTDLAHDNNVQVQTICQDLAEFEINPNSWDGIVSIWCHVPGQLRAGLYRDCVQGLKASGTILIESYTPNQIPLGTGGPKDPDLLPTLDNLRKELSGLSFKIGRELLRDIHEGDGHKGMSAVVQVLASKGQI